MSEDQFIYRGGGPNAVPDDATHISIHTSVKVIPAYLFYQHPNLVELICHDGVERIEEFAFYRCPRLKRVKAARGVLIFERCVFYGCENLQYVECRKLERIDERAFQNCLSLSSINLTSVKIVEELAFNGCQAMTDVEFGKSLESIRGKAFHQCVSLERIAIPLKHGYMNDDIFHGCRSLKHVDLVEGEELRETIDALLSDDWRNDMNEAIDSINRSLPNARAGKAYTRNFGDKALAIEGWIARVLLKIIGYKAQHCKVVNEAASSLQFVFPDDIVMSNVVPFLELPTPQERKEGQQKRLSQ